MRNLSPQRRRTAVVAAACAAIIPSTTLLMSRSHSSSFDFVGGLIVGLAITVSLAMVVRGRRACS